MEKLPEALRLADAIERYNAGVYSQEIHEDYSQAAAELRRLHEVNAELVEALQAVMDSGEISLQLIYESREAADKAKAAFAKATGEQP